MSEMGNLGQLVGKKLTRVRRAFYVHQGEVERSFGDVELQFDSDEIVLLDSGANGYSVDVAYHEWRDPFAGELTPENQEFVATHGKWSIFDVSMEEPFHALLGGALQDVCEIIGYKEQRIGYIFGVAGYLLAVYVHGDETFATVLP